MASNFYSTEEILNYSSESIFSVIIDIEKYPLFLPWCKKIEIINQRDGYIEAKVYIKFVQTNLSYKCIITHKSPNADEKYDGFIVIESFDGAFKYLFSKWELIPIEREKTHVKFSIKFEFNSFLLQKILNFAYKMMQKNIITSFRKRLKNLHYLYNK